MKKKILFLILFVLLFIVMIKILFYLFKLEVRSTPPYYTQQMVTTLIPSKKYHEFFASFSSYTTIPGLKEGGIPQGICYSKKYNILIISEYHKGGAPSVVQVIDFKTKKLIKSIILKDEKANFFYGHAGGIATNDESFWVSDANYHIYTYSLLDLINAENMGTIVAKQKKKLEIKADYINYSNQLLWIGEYYYFPFYRTNKKQIFNTNENIHALLVGYESNTIKPIVAFSTPDKVQGITWTNTGDIIISQSFWILESSHIKIYANVLDKSTSASIMIENIHIPLTQITNEFLKLDIMAPPMTEGIEIIDDEIFILFESAANYYRYYVPNQLDNIYKMKLE